MKRAIYAVIFAVMIGAFPWVFWSTGPQTPELYTVVLLLSFAMACFGAFGGYLCAALEDSQQTVYDLQRSLQNAKDDVIHYKGLLEADPFDHVPDTLEELLSKETTSAAPISKSGGVHESI